MTWANQVRILAENFKALGSVVGNVLINAFKPVIQWLNKVVIAVTSAVETIANALGAIFGWTIEVSPGGQTLDDAASGLDDIGTSADNAGSSMGGAADKANELKKALMGFDEIEKLPDPTSSSSGSGGSGGSGSGGSGGTGSASAGSASLVKTDSIFEKYKSDIKDLEGLGEYIGNALKTAMDKIPWDSIYKKAEGFGKGLADFLNGLFKGKAGETLLGKVGKTIAGTLNTVISASLGFTKNFDFYQFGVNLADAVNQFFRTFDFQRLAKAINGWAKGIKDTIRGFLNTITWKSVLKGATDFLGTLNIDTVEVLIGALVLKNTKKWIMAQIAGGLTSSLTGGITLPSLALGIKRFVISNPLEMISLLTSALNSPLFMETGTKIMEWISEGLQGALPDKTYNMLSNIGAGMAMGAVGGTALAPGLGTVAGAIIGGISSYILAGDKSVDEIWDAICQGWDSIHDKTLEVSLAVKGGLDKFWYDVRNEWSKLTTGKTLNERAKTEEVGQTNTHTGKNGNTYGGESGRSIDVKVNYKAENEKKQLLTPAQKIFQKNPLASKLNLTETKSSLQKKINKVSSKSQINSSVNTKTKASDLQKQLNKFNKLQLNTDTKVQTKASDLQKQLNSLKTGYTMTFPSKISSTPNELQSQLKNKFSNFTLGVTAKAVFSKIEDKLNEGQKTFATVAQFDSRSDKLNATEKTFATKAEFKSRKDSLGSGNKTFGTVARFTSKIDAIAAKNKVISGVVAKLSAINKNGVKFSFVGSLLGKVLSFVLKKDGGIYKNGRWSPVQAFAGGGLPNQGQLFVAREAGPELVGRLPGGGTAVMNNNQIVGSVSAGVYQAVMAAMSQVMSQSQGSGTSPIINVYVGGRQVTDTVVEEVNQRTRATGVCPIIV